MNWKNIALTLIIGATSASATVYVLKNELNETKTVERITLPPVSNTNFIGLNEVKAENSENFEFAAQQTLNAVVHVKVEATENEVYYDPFREFFYGDGKKVIPHKSRGAGSGVIISQDGYIVTNNHVVENADKIEVTLNDNDTYIATIIGTDPSTDLALIKIEGDEFQYIPYGNSDDVNVGQWVLAVGNPFNLTSTVTAGIVSAKARSINILKGDASKNIFPIESFIQTDAAVNPGNSGGALVNTKGELVGINTAIASTTGSFTGYSFAVPANLVKKVAKDLMEYGTVQRAFLGIGIQNIDENLKNEKGLNSVRGVYINQVVENGSADDADLKIGDIITAIGSIEVHKVPELQEQVSRFKPGDKINVTISRNGELSSVDIILKNREGNTEIVKKESSELTVALGATFKKPSSKELKALKISSGVQVTALSSGKLRSAGVREGFIITKVDGDTIETAKQMMEVLKTNSGKGVLIEGIYPNGKKAYYALGL